MKASNLDPKRWWILLAVVLAFLPIVIDMTVLHVAVPSLTQSLSATSNQVLWIIDIYPLLMAGLLVPMGTLADRVGNRKILLIGLVIFGIASVLAAFSQTASMLIAARALLALGGAMIMPCVLGIIRRTFEDSRERAIALGIWGTIGSAGAAIGPLIGGGLLEYFWWGSVFLINVPIMLVVAPMCYFLLSRKEAITPGHWAFGQALLLIVGLISFVYALKAGLGGKQSLLIVLPLVVLSIGLLTIFVRKQLNSPQPMLDLSLFSRPAILAGIIMAMVAAGALAGVELTLAMELQYVIRLTPLQAGLFMVPIMVAAAIGGPIAGFLSNKFGLRLVATMSLILAAIALVSLSYSDFHHPGIIVPFILASIGLTLSIGLTASSIAIMGSVPAEKGGAAGSLESTGYELGTGLGITLFGVFMAYIFGSHLQVPSDLTAVLAEKARLSIGDTYLVASQLPTEQGVALINAGKIAFSSAHVNLLSTAGIIIGILSIVVFFMLAKYRDENSL
ncbi:MULTISPECIES: MFS transporter [Acinetobacter]|uniref:MFS transporter n=6 Tax=Acinetobacter TaxID=469 RepID=A0A2S2F955_9GAMM|nr:MULTISPECIES: MFS transporter [Acinetobacter]QNY29533.1 MFS transporter [Acinetobacter seifertii]ALV74883.1 methyl viologen resistance protein SmvA [Acinetobacter johnsonii XBB1]AWL27469.1 MFS transporter [Acinetobacter defluvii]AYA67330.1 MFS transporter [Acinetobacter sp. WCHA55]AZM39714.1 MFS transporter [Acinetobacter baumannii]